MFRSQRGLTPSLANERQQFTTPWFPMSSIKVQVRPNESLDAALRRFKRQCNHAGIFTQIKENSFYTKPTWARQEELKERRSVIKRAARMRRTARF
jgi:small subunit ribosomal protein S21